MDWNAIGVGVAALGLAVAVLPGLTRRARLRKRLRYSLELLKDLPEDGHDQLREALNAIVAETSSRLARIESRWVQRQAKRRELYRLRRLLRVSIVFLYASVAVTALVPQRYQSAPALASLVALFVVAATGGYVVWKSWPGIAVVRASIKFLFERSLRPRWRSRQPRNEAVVRPARVDDRQPDDRAPAA